ncbi:UPF0481 protein At3g47200-like isoform X2 [Chenopodium quinoa]|nr:UPF0481 protein At3g47200-like isoform X2 [Chenopodium quinoa]XP_021758170.1 UPF0481 protein At3g47200-like isoform X2 [Chenopodium quinoa]
MENNTLQNEITEQDENNGVLLTSMRKELDSLNVSFNENWCIYKVPEFILKGHEYFYQPLVMSIGPVFYKDPKLEPMQAVKWIYLDSFLQHPSNNARHSLNPYIEYFNDEFVKMIVLDAAFLVYLFLSTTLPLSFYVPLVGNNLRAKMIYVKRDLFRLENQIPYFVLKEFFDIAFGNTCTPNPLIIVTIVFIFSVGIKIPGEKAIISIIEDDKIEHLLDLRRMCCCLSLSTPLRNQPNTNPTTDSDSYIHKLLSLIYPSSLSNRLHKRHLKTKTNDYHSTGRLCYTAKQLFDAGVTFMAGETDNPLDITFDNGKLTISKLIIQDSTESSLRNLVYFEQCHYLEDTYFSDYIIFLDQLIDTMEDVQVLVKYKIVCNHLGSDDDAVKLFNNITKNVIERRNNNYFDVGDALNRYASTRRNRWMAILRSKYFNHPWTIMSVIAAIILFVLTLL